MGHIILIFILLLSIGFSETRSKPKKKKVDDDELRLVRDLFYRYDKNVRPVFNKTNPVTVKFGIAYVQLVDLDEKEQMLVSNVWVRQYWNNSLLRWDPRRYGNISTINVDPLRVWLPDVVLYNNANEGHDAGTMYKFKTKVILTSEGSNTWYAPAIIRSGCNIDITFFPFDDQVCRLTFGSWTYNGFDVDIIYDRPSADLKFYLKSAEFILVSAIGRRTVTTFSCCPEPYPNVHFILHLRRQPGFFLFNVIIPSMVITCFAILTFASPHLTGERVGLAIESFLSLSFLCLMVAESIPVNSDVTPLITKFLLTCMVMISLAVLFNLVSLNFVSSKEIPAWVRVLFFHILGPLVGVCEGRNRGVEKRRQRSVLIHSNLPNISAQAEGKLPNLGDGPDVELLKSIGNQKPKQPQQQQPQQQQTPPQQQAIHTYSGPGAFIQSLRQSNLSLQNLDTVVSNLEELVKKSHMEVVGIANKDFWRCVAQTLDRVFLLSFFLTFMFVSAVMLLKGFGHHIKSAQ